MCVSGGSDGKASVYNAGDLGSIPGLGSSLEKEKATHSSTLLSFLDLQVEKYNYVIFQLKTHSAPSCQDDKLYAPRVSTEAFPGLGPAISAPLHPMYLRF